MTKLKKQIQKLLETKSAPKGFHFTKDGKLKRGDADRDGSGGSMLRSDPLDKQRSKVPPVSEAVSIKKANYSWGKMVTVNHGSETSYPLHPEHQTAIKKLKPGESTSFTDETNRKVTASREGDQVHLSGRGTNKKTTVAHSHFTEGSMNAFKQFRNQLQEKTLTPAEMKKREEVAKAIERENPNMPMGMKMAIATKTAKRVAEDTDQLDELKTSTLLRYHTKAGKSGLEAGIKATKSLDAGDYTSATPDLKKRDKRMKGQMQAMSKIQKRYATEEAELEEAITSKDIKMAVGVVKDKRYAGGNMTGAVNTLEKIKKNLSNHPRVQQALKTANEEVDDEGKMAKGQLMRMVNQASALAQMMDDDKQLDGWVQSKLTMASDYLDSVHDYLMHSKQDVDEMEDELEEAAWGKDKAANLKDALNRHTEKAIAANKAGDHEAVKVHQSKMNIIKNQMSKLVKEEETLDEVSKKTAVSYIQKKVSQIAKRPGEAMLYTTKMAGKDYENLKRAYKRAGVKEEVKDEYARKVDKYLKKKYNKEEFELDEATQFPSKEHAISYAKEKVKTHKDSDDGIEVYSMPGGGARVVHTMNSQGRQQVLKGGGKKVTTVTREEVELKDVEDQHYCAKHVYSNVYGEGVVLEGQHADPDENGNIEWYVVNFAEGPKKVYTEKLDIMIAEYHDNHKKKKRITNG